MKLPKNSPRKVHDGDNKPHGVSPFRVGHEATPPPNGRENSGRPHRIPMDSSSDEDNDVEPAVAAVPIKKTDKKGANISSSVNAKLTPSREDANNGMFKKENATMVSPDDAKSREVEARKAALAKVSKQSVKPRRHEGSTSSCTAPMPPRRGSSYKEGDDDPDTIAKRREREASSDLAKRREREASSDLQNARKMPPTTTFAGRRSTKECVSSISNHSSGSASTTVTQNTSTRFLTGIAKAQIQAVSLVLEEDDDDVGQIVVDPKSNAVSAKTKQSQPTATRRHSRAETNVASKPGAAVCDGASHPSVARQRRATIATCATATLQDSQTSNHSTKSNDVGAHSVPISRRESITKSIGDDDGDAVQEHLASLAASQNRVPRLIPDDNVAGGAATIMEEDNTHLDDNDEFANDASAGVLEAQAGISVTAGVTPGAFAVDGMNAQNNSADGQEESIYPYDDVEMDQGASGVFSVRLSGNGSVQDPTFTDPNSALYLDPELANDEPPSALEAELHEVIVFDGRVLTDDQDQGWTVKHRRRLLCTLACLIFGGTAAVLAVVSQLERNKPRWQALPTIEGWTQVGQNLTGPTDDDRARFGYDIAMDGSAQRIAIGAPGVDNSVNELMVGEVQIMDWNGTQFVPTGLITGPGPGSQAGSAVAMSKNGKRVAVASPFFASAGGSVAVYEEGKDKWKMVGQILVGDTATDGDERFGSSIALNAAGNILAVGSSLGDSEHGSNTGYVKVFQLQTYSLEGLQDQWVQLGSAIFGENPGDMFGWSVTMSASGDRIAAGSIGSSSGGIAEFAGQVRVFDYIHESSSWTKVGSSLSGISAFDSFGASCALSSDGDVLAVGAIGFSTAEAGVDVGHVRVFQNVGGSWVPLGQTLVGDKAFDTFGYSVSLSEDGKVVAVGSPRNDEFAESSGQVQVYELDRAGLLWNRRGSSIGGSYQGRDLFGWTIALSANGTVLAGGAPFSTFDGRLNDVGSVRVYIVDPPEK